MRQGRPVVEAALMYLVNNDAARDVGPGTIHNDAPGLCPNRSDGRDRRVPYARDHDRPLRGRCRHCRRAYSVLRLASPMPIKSMSLQARTLPD